MFSGNYFSYGDVNSEQYELMIVLIDEKENTKIGGTLEYTNFFNNDGKYEVMHSRYPEEVFSFNIELNNVPANTTISLTYNPKIITCSNTLYQKNIYTDSSIWNKKWLTFLQGINQLNLCGDINTITLSYQVAKAVF